MLLGGKGVGVGGSGVGVGSRLSAPSSMRIVLIRSPACAAVLHGIAARDLVEHFVALDHLAEDGVSAVEPVGRGKGDEELAAIGAGTGIGHGQQAGAVKAEAGSTISSSN